MKKDKYGVIFNNKNNYKAIAQLILDVGPTLISWTDREGSQLDILFNLIYFPLVGPIQGGLQQDYLYVSIMHLGAFGFKIEKADTTSNYYSEKLRVGTGSTVEELTKFLNGIRRELFVIKYEKNH